MMSTAEVISMAMAELLVVMLKASGRHGRTYDGVHDQLIICRSLIAEGDGRHVEETNGHRVEVGVGVLPNREGRRCYSGL